MSDRRGVREYLRTAERLIEDGFPGDAYRRATTLIEAHARDLAGVGRRKPLHDVLRLLIRQGILEESLAERVHKIRRRRNELAHDLREPLPDEAVAALAAVREFIAVGLRVAHQFRSPYRIGRVARDSPLRDAVRIMREEDFSQLLVVGGEEEPIPWSTVCGLITETSILSAWDAGSPVFKVEDCLADEPPGRCGPHDGPDELRAMLRTTPLVCLVEPQEDETPTVTGVIVRADLLALAF